MSEIEALLDGYSGAGSGVNEEHIVIGRDRYITVPESLKKLGVQYDHNVETLIFDCPRYWDDVDLSTLSVYITYMRTDGVPGSYSSQRVTVDENDDTLMHFEWTITKSATLAAGPIVFLVCIKSIDEEGNETVHWNSELNEDTYISEGLEVNSTIEQMFPDVITQLVTRMNTIENKFDPSNVVAMENLLNGIKDGTTVVGKATADADGNVISETYETKANAAATYATKEEVVSVTSGQMQGEINKIKSGETTVGKATSDADGNNIKDTYATKDELADVGGEAIQSEITKIKDGTTVVGKATCDATGNNIEATYAKKSEIGTSTGGVDSEVITAIIEGGTVVGKATADADGNVISETYATKDELAGVGYDDTAIQSEITNIKDGVTTVSKAHADGDGNNIKDTYATKDEVADVASGALQEEITKIKDGTTVVGSTKAITGSVNGETHAVEFVTEEEYKTLEANGTIIDDTIYIVKDDDVIESILDGTVVVGKARGIEYLYLHTVLFRLEVSPVDDSNARKYIDFSISYTDTSSTAKSTNNYTKWLLTNGRSYRTHVCLKDSSGATTGSWYNTIEVETSAATAYTIRLYSDNANYVDYGFVSISAQEATPVQIQ